MDRMVHKTKRHIRVGPRRKKRKWDWLDGCDGCDCDVPCCDFGLLSTSMLLVSRLGRRDRMTIGAIQGYRKLLSPRVPVKCRYEPSCSAYGLEAVQRHGSGRGLRLAAARLRRCKPGVPFGTHDPVP